MKPMTRPAPADSMRGAMSTRTSPRAASGRRPMARMMAIPPAEAPTSTGTCPWDRSTWELTANTSPLMASKVHDPSGAQSLSPWPRRSRAMVVQPLPARRSVVRFQEPRVWPPPCSRTTVPLDAPSGAHCSPRNRTPTPSNSMSATVTMRRKLTSLNTLEGPEVDVDPFPQLTQGQAVSLANPHAVGVDHEHRVVGVDPADAAAPGEGVGALRDQLRGAVAGEQRHHHHDVLRSDGQVHGAIHRRDGIGPPGVPVAEIDGDRDLECAEH